MNPTTRAVPRFDRCTSKSQHSSENIGDLSDSSSGRVLARDRMRASLMMLAQPYMNTFFLRLCPVKIYPGRAAVQTMRSQATAAVYSSAAHPMKTFDGPWRSMKANTLLLPSSSQLLSPLFVSPSFFFEPPPPSPASPDFPLRSVLFFPPPPPPPDFPRSCKRRIKFLAANTGGCQYLWGFPHLRLRSTPASEQR